MKLIQVPENGHSKNETMDQQDRGQTSSAHYVTWCMFDSISIPLSSVRSITKNSSTGTALVWSHFENEPGRDTGEQYVEVMKQFGTEIKP